MIEYFWVVVIGEKNHRIVWDSISKNLFAPITVSLTVQRLIEEKAIVWMTAVGPKFVASLEEHLSAYATIQEAIEINRLEIYISSPTPIEPESELEDNQAS